MMLFNQVADAFAASRQWDSASLSRLEFWTDSLGSREFAAVTPDEVDDAMVRLAQRGRLLGGKRPTAASGKPLKGSTLNRYLTTLGSVYRFARRARLVPRNFVPPTRGIEKLPEPVDPDRYLRTEEVERILACARVVDRRWKRMPALIIVALHTGLRKGSLQKLRWDNVDLAGRRLVLGKTKNGDPIGSALTARCVAELNKLPGKEPGALVFGNRSGEPFHFGRSGAYRAKWRACPAATSISCGTAAAARSRSAASIRPPSCR